MFTEEPGLLYLLDIHEAMMHLNGKGKFSDIPKMNRNIKFEKQASPASSTPLPPPKIPTPIPQRFIPWVSYDKAKAKDVKVTKSKLDFPFDLYLDAVRFLPDNSTFIKVSTVFIN